WVRGRGGRRSAEHAPEPCAIDRRLGVWAARMERVRADRLREVVVEHITSGAGDVDLPCGIAAGKGRMLERSTAAAVVDLDGGGRRQRPRREPGRDREVRGRAGEVQLMGEAARAKLCGHRRSAEA